MTYIWRGNIYLGMNFVRHDPVHFTVEHHIYYYGFGSDPFSFPPYILPDPTLPDGSTNTFVDVMWTLIVLPLPSPVSLLIHSVVFLSSAVDMFKQLGYLTFTVMTSVRNDR